MIVIADLNVRSFGVKPLNKEREPKMNPVRKVVFLGIGLGSLLLALTACNPVSKEDPARTSAMLTVNEANAAIEQGTVRWDTFEKYKHTDIGSGLYLWEYEVEGGHKLQLGGADLNQAPTQIRLIDAEGAVVKTID